MFKNTLLCGALVLGLSACQTANTTQTETIALEGSWQVEQIQGRPTIDNSPAQITFAAEGQLHGNNSCNNFFGQYSQQGQELKLMPAGSTMKACIEALMQQEQQFMQAMPLVTKAQFTHGKLSLLDSNNQAVLVLTQLK
ncbi:MAG: META domain-containing protein [Shewanella sp.]|uniref:META domain-containing protein n=1 Tax=Shewanella sp. TaxID=50422 RepID=UPI003F32E05E